MEVHLFAVLVAGIVSMVLGALWYSPLLFAKQWMALSGMSEVDIKKAKEKVMGKSYALNFLASLVMAYAIAYIMKGLGTTGLGSASHVGLGLWFGFVATVTLGGVLWENKPWKLWFLNNAYYVISLSLMAVVIVAMS